MHKQISIIGAGSWGTALAIHLDPYLRATDRGPIADLCKQYAEHLRSDASVEADAVSHPSETQIKAFDREWKAKLVAESEFPSIPIFAIGGEDWLLETPCNPAQQEKELR